MVARDERGVTAATWPREAPLDERLLTIDPTRRSFGHAHVRDLPASLRTGDVLVVNDAATLPASLRATTTRGDRVEVRLAGPCERDDTFRAVLLGEGDWRTPTEQRPAPPVLAPREVLRFDGSPLRATVAAVAAVSPRLVTLRFDAAGGALIDAIHRAGRPIQYAYLRGPLALWHVQTRYASRPWASELPSAGRPLTFGLIAAVRARGVSIATITHAAGVSSTGDAALDAALPLPERYDVPARTVEQIRAARALGGRVIAVGTSVVRALEGCAAAHGGQLVAATGETDLRIGPAFSPRVVDGLLTGIHEPKASHFELLQAFAPRALIEQAYLQAESLGYLCHEFGDSNLILADSA